MPIMDISNGAEAAEAQAKVDEENNKKFAKKISLFGQGVDLFIDAASKLASSSYDTEFEKIAARADLLMFDIDALSQKSIMAADMVSKAYVSAVTNSITSITDGINAGAYSSASDIIDLSAQKKIFDLEQQRIDLENKNSRNWFIRHSE